MPRINPLSFDQLDINFQKKITDAESQMEFTPNDGLTFARIPGLVEGLNKLAFSIYGKDGLISNELKYLISILSSIKSGSNYCVAHTIHGAEKIGLLRDKIEQITHFKSSSLFSNKEKSVLNIVEQANKIPIKINDNSFDTLKEYFNENQICEIVAVISLFGFLNRWNAIMETDVELAPLSIIKKYNLT